MSLTPAQIAHVQRTWQKCVPIADVAADVFYDRLFLLDPSLRALFPADLREQKAKLMRMITTAVRGLSDLGALVPALEGLGRRHAGYRVAPSHYATVGTALLYTLEKGLGGDWTPPVADAWAATYAVLSSTMIAAAGSA